MFAASDIADWWDKQHSEAKAALDHFVDENPNLFGVVVATAVATAMEVGAGTVDVLRLGEGAAQGGWGFAKDALRVVSIAGTLGKAAKILQSARGVRLAKLIVDPGGGRCGYVSATMALKQTGQKAFVAVDDLARELGVTLDELGGSTLGQRIQQLRAIGAKVGLQKSASRIQEVISATKRDGSVAMIRIVGQRPNGETVAHAVYGFYDHMGRFRIMDRGGRAGRLGEVVESLDQLAAKYGVSSWRPEAIANLENLFLRFVGPKGTATLALSALAHTATDPETVAQAFEVHKVRATAKPALTQTRYHTVVPGDSLSKLANRYYGNMYKWPVIYSASRDVIGNNPNLIKPGQRLWIPDLPKVN